MDKEEQDCVLIDSNKTESELISETEKDHSNGTDVKVKCEKDEIISKVIVIKFQENRIFLLFFFLLFNLKMSSSL